MECKWDYKMQMWLYSITTVKYFPWYLWHQYPIKTMNSKNPIIPNSEKSEQEKKNAKIKVFWLYFILLFLLYNQLSSKIGIKFNDVRPTFCLLIRNKICSRKTHYALSMFQMSTVVTIMTSVNKQHVSFLCVNLCRLLYLP